MFDKTSKVNYNFFTEHCHKDAESCSQKTKKRSHFSKNHLAFLISWNKNTFYKNDVLWCSCCMYCTFKLSVQFPQFLWTDKIIRWSNLCGAHSWSFGGGVFKWRTNVKERFAEAVNGVASPEIWGANIWGGQNVWF